MATDFWPDQDGRLVDGCTIGFCYAESTSITANYAVKMGTSTASRIGVGVCAANGDGIGVALKTPVAVGDPIPVLMMGLIKMKLSAGAMNTGVFPKIGSFIINSVTDGISGTGTVATTNLQLFLGPSYILGIAWATATALSDEIPVFVGKCV